MRPFLLSIRRSFSKRTVQFTLLDGHRFYLLLSFRSRIYPNALLIVLYDFNKLLSFRPKRVFMELDDLPEYSTRITKDIEYPFCKTKLKALYKPSMLQFHVSRISAKTARVPYRTQERYEILVDKCPTCGKTKKKIEKALRSGKEPSNDEVAKRLREAGLDPSKLKRVNLPSSLSYQQLSEVLHTLLSFQSVPQIHPYQKFPGLTR